jgi:Co/Zn/Cd efflux system component
MADHCCGKNLELEAMQANQRRVLRIVFAINATTFLMMVVAAFYSRSTSLLSGTLDNLGDALTYALSLAVIGSSTRAKGRVALVKGALILAAALGVAVQIAWRVAEPTTPVVEAMGVAAVLNLVANGLCLWLLTPFRRGDVNLASAWEYSRNDVFEGFAVLAAALGVWMFGAGWPDLVVAVALLLMFLRSAIRVFRAGWRAMRESTAEVG